jgi:hypothetical protein
MDAEAQREWRGILDDVGELLDEHLAGAEWGRLLVEVVPGPHGEPVVAGVDVEEIVGDEARVDAVFGSPAMREVLPILAKASEALCGLEGVDLEEVRGGTFVRRREGGFVWLPALVHTPSGSFDAQRDAVVLALRKKNEALGLAYGEPFAGKIEADLAHETASVETPGRPPLRARATLIGTFVPAARTWGWGSSNPHLPREVRAASAAIVDGIAGYGAMWELSTPVFPTDEATAWAIAALVCERAGADAVCCGREPEGSVFLLLRDVGRGD